MKLQDKIVIITGAGSGTGSAMAGLFAQEGAKVTAADISLTRVQNVIKELGDLPGEIFPHRCDVTSQEEIGRLFDAVRDRFGRLDVLINNAGITDNRLPMEATSDELWQRVLDVNLTAVMYACRASLAIMSTQEEGGVILNVASVAGLHGGIAGAAYTASKFGVVGLTQNIGHQYAAQGIRCNAICPGDIETPVGNSIKAGGSQLSQMLGGLRRGSAEEVAAVALFLASEDASFVNGATLTVDGGSMVC